MEAAAGELETRARVCQGEQRADEQERADTMTIKAVRCDVYSRIVGYYTPTNVWNLGKKEEFALRNTISLEQIEQAVKEDSCTE
jgi:anaerobic ribonucleoside-triphosphate reductase